MAAVQHFRSALHGFNREDVIHYIEYFNNQYRSQINQLNTQLQVAQEKAENAEQLQQQLDAALARCKELEEQLAQQQAPQVKENEISPEAELEAYRRAERTERLAKERAEQIYAQANAVLADATVKTEEASAQIGVIADQIATQLQACQESVTSARNTFQDAVATLYAIRPKD